VTQRVVTAHRHPCCHLHLLLLLVVLVLSLDHLL
jgi:hypothetical protein